MKPMQTENDISSYTGILQMYEHLILFNSFLTSDDFCRLLRPGSTEPFDTDFFFFEKANFEKNVDR